MPRHPCIPKLRYLCAALTLAFAGTVHGGVPLFSYGAAAGDSMVPHGDDNYAFTSWAGTGPAGTTPYLSFYGTTYKDMYVNTNGAISFGKGIEGYSTAAFPASGLSTPMIAQFWADANTSTTCEGVTQLCFIGTGSVWYRSVQDAQQLNSMSKMLAFNRPELSSFSPTSAQVITWDHVAGFGLPNSQTNTFQMVLISDGSSTYSMMLYPDNSVQWLRGTASRDAYPFAGYQSGYGQNYNLGGSGTAAMLNFPSMGDTPTPGLFIQKINGAQLVKFNPLNGDRAVSYASRTWSAAGGGNWGRVANWGTLTGGDFSSITNPSAKSWINGVSAIFKGSGGVITLDTAITALQLKVSSSGYTFTSASVDNSLQIGGLILPNADTKVTFGGNLVLLTHQDDGGIILSGTEIVKRTAITQGQLTFTDNAILVAQNAAQVDGANLFLKKSAQVQLYTKDAITRNTTLSFDSSAGGTGGVFDLRGLSTSIGAISSANAGAGRITSSIAGGALTVDFSNKSSTFSGTISGAMSLDKQGSGVLTLSGNNSYTGNTQVKAGTLIVDGSVTSSAFSVDAGAVLGGHGSVGAVQMAGTLSPGNSPGTLSTRDFTFAGNSSYVWQMNDAELVGGADLLAVNGVLNFAGSSAAPVTIRLQSLLQNNAPGDVFNFGARHNHSYTIATATGGIIGLTDGELLLDASGFSNALYGGSWNFAVHGNQLALNFTAAAVPEPAHLSMLLAGLALTGWAARRARTKRA